MNKSLTRSQAGFSLMEILLVLGLIAMIIGLVVANLSSIFGSSQEDVAKIEIKNLETPLMAYRIKMGGYPSSEQGLQALITAPAGKEKKWRGPYLDELPTDPWDHAYQYRYPGMKNQGKYDLWSLGPDGVESGDDIGNWKD